MSFLYPTFLVALGLIAIPILLHLFHLRRFKTLYFSNISFIKELEIQSRSAKKIKNFLILLMRILAISMLVLAFAQPLFQGVNNLTDNKKSVRIIFIDNTNSMSALGIEGELLSQAKVMAQELIKKDPLGSQYVILSNSFLPEEMRLKNQPDALDYIDKIKAAPVGKKANAVFKKVDDLLKQLNLNGELLIFSDAQEYQWTLNEKLGFDYPVKFIQLTAENNNNLNVDSVWTSVPVMRPRGQFDLNVRVKNLDPDNVPSATLDIDLNKNRQTVNVEFEGNKEKTITLSYVTPSRPGFYPIEIEINDNQVHFDDQLFAGFEVKKQLNVGVVNGIDAGKYVDLVYDLDSYYQASSWSEKQLSLSALKENELIILFQVNQINQGLSDLLVKHIQDGKSLALVPGPQADLEQWNNLLSALKMPLLQKTDTSSIFMNKLHVENPFFKGLFETPEPKIQIPVKRKTRLLNQGSSSLALISYSDGSPFLARGTSSEGEIFLFNSDLHKGNSNILSSELFSTLFLRIGELSGKSQPLFSYLGKPASLKFQSENSNDKTPAKLVKGSGIFIPQQQRKQSKLEVTLSGNSEEIGLESGYHYLLDEGDTLGIIALNHDRLESELNYKSQEQLIKEMRDSGIKNFSVENMKESAEVEKIRKTGSSDFWRYLLFAALFFFIMEMVFIRFLK